MMIQGTDKLGDDPYFVQLWNFGGIVDFTAGQFLVIDDRASSRSFLAQIIGPQLNLNRDAFGPSDSTTLNALEALVSGRYQRDMVVKEVFLHRAKLIKEITAEASDPIRRRPQIGSSAKAAAEAEIARAICLPLAQDQLQHIGHLVGSNIPLAVDNDVLNLNILIAGSIGFGKSNVMASVFAAAQALPDVPALIILDPKPDYQSMHEPNNEGCSPLFRGLPNVKYWRIGSEARMHGDTRTGCYQEVPISVPARELDFSILAANLFPRDNERNAMEATELLLEHYAEDHAGQQWTLDEFIAWAVSSVTQAIYVKSGGAIASATYQVIVRKVGRRRRQLPWVDQVPRPNVNQAFFGSSHAGGQRLGEFKIADEVRPATINVIRIPASMGGGRSYALFLSYLFKATFQLVEVGQLRAHIIFGIDEAQDIFSGASPEFVRLASHSIEEAVRKGRSRRINFIFGVQAASAIPEEIVNNLKSQFILNHGNLDLARTAASRINREELQLTASFGPGDALVSIWKTHAIVECKMNLSPFKLTKVALEQQPSIQAAAE